MENLLLNTMERDIKYLEAHGDMEDAQIKRNELELYVLFPDARFIIDGDFLPMLDDLLTEEKHIFLTHTRYCCCWDEEEYKPTEFYEIKGDKITYRYVFNELIRQDFNPDCNHYFLELITQTTNIQFDLFMGS